MGLLLCTDSYRGLRCLVFGVWCLRVVAELIRITLILSSIFGKACAGRCEGELRRRARGRVAGDAGGVAEAGGSAASGLHQV